jgi:integrase
MSSQQIQACQRDYCRSQFDLSFNDYLPDIHPRPSINCLRTRSFQAAVKKSRILPCRFHDLRHTFATRLVQAGEDIYSVQKIGRWKNISMVMRHAHHYPESLRSGAERLDKVRERISTNLAQPKEKGVTACAATP